MKDETINVEKQIGLIMWDEGMNREEWKARTQADHPTAVIYDFPDHAEIWK